MEKNATYYEELIATYFAGEATPEAIQELSQWLDESPAHLALFDDYRKTWMLATRDAIDSTISVSRAWDNLSGQLNIEQAEISETPSGVSKIKPMFAYWKVAAAIVLVLGIAAAMFYLQKPVMQLVVAEAGNMEYVLPDGSVVNLYKGSSIEFDKDFHKKARKISMEGEAYFSVKHDASHPFIVRANDANVEVLGTEFDVKAVSGAKRVEVSLTRGSVKLYFDSNNQIAALLKPGESGVADLSSRAITTSTIRDANYMAWKTREITFNNTPLEEVAAALSKVYQTSIQVKGNTKNQLLTATFNRQELDDILRIIGSTLDVPISRNGDTIIIDTNSIN